MTIRSFAQSYKEWKEMHNGELQEPVTIRESREDCDCHYGYHEVDWLKQVDARWLKRTGRDFVPFTETDPQREDYENFVASVNPDEIFLGRCRSCWAKKMIAELSPEKSSPCTWETWRTKPQLMSAVQHLKSWKGEDGNWTTLLHAERDAQNFGTGKTHASIATCVSWILDGREAIYFDAADIIESRRISITDKAYYDERLETYLGLVVIDDLGKEADTQWTRETIDRVIDKRYRKRMPTLITTNLDLDKLTYRYPRTLSRISQGAMFTWNSEDHRSEGQWA